MITFPFAFTRVGRLDFNPLTAEFETKLKTLTPTTYNQLHSLIRVHGTKTTRWFLKSRYKTYLMV